MFIAGMPRGDIPAAQSRVALAVVRQVEMILQVCATFVDPLACQCVSRGFWKCAESFGIDAGCPGGVSCPSLDLLWLLLSEFAVDLCEVCSWGLCAGGVAGGSPTCLLDPMGSTSLS